MQLDEPHLHVGFEQKEPNFITSHEEHKTNSLKPFGCFRITITIEKKLETKVMKRIVALAFSLDTNSVQVKVHSSQKKLVNFF